MTNPEGLREALRPFAELAERFDPDRVGGNMPRNDDDAVMEWPMVDKTYRLTLGHLRAARAALAPVAEREPVAGTGEPVGYVYLHKPSGQEHANLGKPEQFVRDNPSCVFVRWLYDTTPPAAAAGREGLTEDDVYTLLGEANIRAGYGHSDMPAYFMGLAKRIALALGNRHLADRVTELDAARASTPEGETR